MKILVVMDDYYNKTNGMCISSQRFVKAFQTFGHEVRIMTNNRYHMSEYPLPVLKIPIFAGIIEKEGYTFARPQQAIIDEAIQWADIIHIEDPFFLCRKAAITAKKFNKPLTGTFHIYPENLTYAVHLGQWRLLNHLFMTYFLKGVFNYCDYLQCPTETVKNTIQAHHPKAELKVISNGIDDYFLNGQHNYHSSEEFRVISVGRYAVEKNQQLLIQAISQSNYKDKIQLTLAGKGPLEAKLKAYANKLDVQVEFGFYNHADLRELMLKSDLYVHCAKVEVEGMSCMEAFACGCVPLIADFPLSSTKSYALTTHNLFNAKDATDLTQKIDWFYEHRQELTSLSHDYQAYATTLSTKKSASQALEMMAQAITKNSNC